MSKSKTTWTHAFDIYFQVYRFRADYVRPDGSNRVVFYSIFRTDLFRKGRLAAMLRKMQRAIDKDFHE